MSMRSWNSLALILVLTGIGGCASVPKQQYNRAANQTVKTIALLDPAGSDEYQVRNFGHLGNSFGVIGVLIAEADIASKSKSFTAAMSSRNYAVRREFREALKSALEKDGYTVEVLTVTRKEKFDLLERYDSVASNADALLDLTIGSGYFCATASTDYIPYVRTDVQLVKRESREILYREIISYGYQVPYDKNNHAVSIAAAKDHFFANFDALLAAPDKALAGMRAGIPLVAEQIARDISP